MQDPFHSQPPQYQPDPSVTPPPPPSGDPYQSSPSYPPQSAYPPSAYPQHTTYPPQQPYPAGAPTYQTPPQAYPTPPQQPYPQQTYPPQPYTPYGAPVPPPQQPRKKQSLLWIIIGVVLAFLIVGGGVIAAVSHNNNSLTPTPTAQVHTNPTQGTQPTTAPTQASQPTTLPTNSTSGSHKIGDSVSIDGWIVKVNGAKISKGGPYDTPQHAGDVYLEIDVSIINQTGKAQSFSSDLSFTLKDNTGQQYSQTFVDDGSPNSPNGTIQNGSTLRGTMPFEVAPTLKSFELDFEPDPFNSTDVATWNITVS